MKRVALLLPVLAFAIILQAQSNLPIPNWHFFDKATVPQPTEDMPEYAQLLYADEVNMIELEVAVQEYYLEKGWDEFQEDLEHDPFAKFFFRWYPLASEYADEDAVVRNKTTEELLSYRQTVKVEVPNNLAASPTSSWEFLGPKETLWRKEHRADQPVAPWQVNIYCMAIAPSNSSILYAGSETGELYKSTDKGLNWIPLDYNFSRAILSVAVHPTNPDIVYTAHSQDIIKSTDGGATWSIVYTASGLSCNALKIHPTLPDILFAGTGNGLLKTSNAGATWTTQISNLTIDDVEFKPGDPSTVYAIARTGSPDTYSFYKSTNVGATFALSMTGWGTIYERSGARLSVSEAAPDQVVALLLTHDGSDGDQKPILMRSIDSAANWTQVVEGNSGALAMNNGQGYYDMDVLISKLDANEIIVATTTAYKTTDGGTTWSAVGGYAGPFGIHPDIQALESYKDGANEDTWILTDGGINLSTDFYTSDWSGRINGIDGTDMWGFAQGWNEDYCIGGRYHNGNMFMHENYPDKKVLRGGGAESATGWAMHGRERHAAFDDIAETIIPENISDVSQEGAFLFTKHPNIFWYGSGYSRVMVDLEDFMTVYVGNGTSFWKSIDGGGTWEILYTFPGDVYFYDISRANPDVIYVVTTAGLYKSTDRGVSFSPITMPGGFTSWHAVELRLVVSATNPDEAWVLNKRSGASSNGTRVYKTSDGGASWTNWTTAALNNRKWGGLAHQAGTNGGVYIASLRGDTGQNDAKVLYRDNTMSDWVDFSSGLPKSANPTKILPFYRDNKLRWAGNRGIWEIDLYEENWAPIAQPFVSGGTQFCNRDIVEFDSYSVAKASATYSWSIPGASTVTNLNAREVFATFPGEGTFTATLTVTQDGQSSSKSVDVTIEANCNAEAIAGNALQLTGNNSDYAVTGDPLNVTSNTMTWSAWVKPDGIQDSSDGIIFHRAGGNAAGINFTNSNNTLGIHWNDSQWWWDSGLIVEPDVWSHVALVVTPTEYTLYVNGVPSVNTSDPANATFGGVIGFGADPGRSDRRMNGELDEIIIYNRSFTQEEIRELMHFTRDPLTDPDILGYWQFNRTAGVITDRAATNHASLVGAATRVTSTAPVGSGQSNRMTVNAAGNYDFTDAGVTLEFPAGTTPNGEICVSRIDAAPDQAPTANVSPSYWAIHNYGTNSTFDELTSITFNGIGNVTTAMANEPSQIKFYKRGSGDCGATWGTIQDDADAAVAGANGSATFSNGNGQTSFSQFIVSFESVALPTELLNFVAYKNNAKNVQLDWKTNNEINLAHYEIERSRDGANFENIGKVAAKGEDNAQTNYGFEDKSPLRGISYYRLKMVDLDGSFEYSGIKSIVFDALADKFVLYPNPKAVTDKLHIMTMTEEDLEIKFYAADGEEAGEFEFSGDTALDLSHLPAGVYSYTVEAATWRKSGVLVVQ